MRDKLDSILEALKGEIRLLFLMVLEDDTISTNLKVGINTLKDSNLYKDLRVERTDFTYNLYYNFYADYIESGRRKGARKIPIDVIIEWMRRKHISNDIRVAYAIRESIFKEGIKARPILSSFDARIDDLIMDYMDRIFDALTYEIDRFFEN